MTSSLASPLSNNTSFRNSLQGKAGLWPMEKYSCIALRQGLSSLRSIWVWTVNLTITRGVVVLFVFYLIFVMQNFLNKGTLFFSFKDNYETLAKVTKYRFWYSLQGAFSRLSGILPSLSIGFFFSLIADWKWCSSNMYWEDHRGSCDQPLNLLPTSFSSSESHCLDTDSLYTSLLWGASLYPPRESWMLLGCSFSPHLASLTELTRYIDFSFCSAFHLSQDRVAISSHLHVKLETGNQPCTF